MSGLYFLFSLLIMMWIIIWSVLRDKDNTGTPTRSTPGTGRAHQKHKSH